MISLTEDENHNPLIVDGYLRYQLIRELKKEGNWSDYLLVLEIPLDNAKFYHDIQTYAQYAHELLEIDSEFFYETFFIKCYSLKKAEIKELLATKNDEKLIKEIIDKMKNTADKNTQTLHGSIYGQAKIIVDGKHKPAYERLIRKQTASDTETEEIKNTLFAKASESDGANFATNTKLVNSTCEETTEENSGLNIADENNFDVAKENYSTKSDNAKVSLLKRKYCVVVTSQPLPEDIQARIKEIIEDNIAYEVKVTYASVGEGFL